ncbi:WD repeat-containing protein 47, partial [Perkinsus olseni]
LETETNTRLCPPHENDAVEYFRSVVMAGRWGDVLRLVTKLYSSATAAEQRAAQFRVYRQVDLSMQGRRRTSAAAGGGGQEFLELLFLTEGDEEDSRGANGPLVEKAVVEDVAEVLGKIKPLCSNTEWVADGGETILTVTCFNLRYAELYEALTAPSLEECRQGWQSKAGGRYGLWRSYVPKLMEVYGSSGWAECGMVTPGCGGVEDTLEDLVALGLRTKYFQSPKTTQTAGGPQVPSEPAVLQKLGEPAREVGQTEGVSAVDSRGGSRICCGGMGVLTIQTRMKIDIPWDTENGHGSMERSSRVEEAVRDSRQVMEIVWDPSKSRPDASRAIVESSGEMHRKGHTRKHLRKETLDCYTVSPTLARTGKQRLLDSLPRWKGIGVIDRALGQEHIEVTQIWQYEDTQAIRCVSFSPCARYLGIGTNSRSLMIFDSAAIEDGETEELLRRDRYHAGSIYCMSWSPGSTLLVTGSNDQSVQVLSFDHSAELVSPREQKITPQAGTVRTVSA